ncbi:Cys/Met metabolism PLP-dependent enzyme containing HRDC domain [Deinococcus aerius]|uniref:Cys/Met metabolism PLP-dependent enzyme containing HRDC domain n=1 Tax=Deinococcus aerius TaxID=200253 RepID=A0A2I9D5Y0_9DEIO|nr:HRDC domain-containing protein [Deinococcus aerius]GBF05810.1 Cys/Met metabolism PLP-dependent enzyme containing HRDC domain [Deinococcus aerius]
MTDSPDLPRPDPRPDARLVGLHAERGDPHARLSAALAALEGADWGLTLAGEAALARQLARLLGPGVVRVDERLGVNRAALAEQGLAAAGLDADWTGARAAWLAEPDERLLRRAERAGVPVIVDATLAPGGGWFTRGAAYVVYRDGVTLTGFSEGELALLFGTGGAPAPAAPAPADVTVALALRDVATLPLRLARGARTVGLLAERLGGGALPFGPTALLLPPDAAPDTPWLPGGVLAATRSVEGGVVFTPGLQDAETALALLRGQPRPVADPLPLVRELAEVREAEPTARVPGRDSRPERPRQEREVRSPVPQPDLPRPDEALPDAPEPPARVTFDAPPVEDVAPTAPAPPAEEEVTWTPEIVFSDFEPESPTPLPTPVSGGPDEPELEVQPPLATAPAPEPEPEVEDVPTEDAAPFQPAEPEPEPAPTAPDLTPDLPTTSGEGGALDPAADLTDEQAAIYARLREWRNAEARRQEVSRFIIASNATLAEIARRVPYTLDDLRAVRGMGPERLRKYGDKILEVVRG